MRVPKGYHVDISDEFSGWASYKCWSLSDYIKKYGSKERFIKILFYEYGRHDSIGNIVLQEYKQNIFETHVSLGESYRNKGLGVFLYTYAINYARKRHWKVTSSTTPSIFAQRAWKSKRLRSKFEIRKIGNRYNVRGKR